MAAKDHLGPQFYHATKHEFRPGDVLTPEGGADKPNYSYPPDLAGKRPVYFGGSARGVYKFGNQAAGRGPARVYQVEPRGKFEKDKGAPSDDAYRTWGSLRVVRELPEEEIWK